MSPLFTFTLLAKVTLLLLGALGFDQLFRHKSAVACAAMWNAALLALAAIPLLCLTMPAVKIPIAFAVGAEPARLQPQLTGTDATTLPTANLPLPSDIAEESGAVPAETVISVPPRTSFTIPSVWQLMGGIYLAGTGILALRLVLSLLAVRRVMRQATDIQDVAWQRSLQDSLSQIGSRAKIRLKQSTEISVPIACGWLAPTIVIPADLVAALSTAARKGVLIHELAHLLRRDYPWQLLLRCLQVVLWFHPLLWWAERRIHFVRERVCDDFSIFILGDSEMYCDTLLDIATRCHSRLSLSLGLAIVRKGRLAQRLSAMEESEGSREYELSGMTKWAVGSAALLLALVLSSFALQPSAVAQESTKKDEPITQNKKDTAAKPDEERPKEDAKAGEQAKLKEQKVTITGIVTDENGKPVKEADVYLFAMTYDPAAPPATRASVRQLKKVAVNAKGQYEIRDVAIPIIPVPKAERERTIESTTLEIVALTKEQKFAWRGPAQVNSADETRRFGNRIVIETGRANQLDLWLRSTKGIPGRVIDEKGKPVAGAVVRLVDCRRYTQDPLVKVPDSDSLNYCLGGEVPAAPDAIALRKSDVEGRFEFSEIPVDMKGVFFVTHPDYSTVGLGATNAEYAIPNNGVKEDFELQRGEVTVKLRRTYSVPVEVHFEDGDKPAKAMFVRAVEAMAENLKSPAFNGGITDERGNVNLKLPAGKFKIEAGTTQYGGTVAVTVDEKSSAKPVVLRVPGAPTEKPLPGTKLKEEPAKEKSKEEKKADEKTPAKPAVATKEAIADRKIENAESDPKTATDYYNRGMARKLPQEYDEALADFTKAIELDFGFADAYFSRSSIYTSHPDFAKRDYAKGVADLSKILELEPKYFSARFNRALAYESLQEYDKAIADYSRVFDKDTDFSRAAGSSDEYLALTYHYRGRAYQWYKHDDAKALADFTEALRLDPKIEMVHYRRGNAYHGLKEYAKAAEDYTIALQTQPDYPNLLISIAWQLATCPDAKFRDGKKAIELATKANETFKWKLPEHGDALAAAYAESGQFSEAVKWEEKAIELLEKEQVDSRKKMQNRLKLYQANRPFREGE